MISRAKPFRKRLFRFLRLALLAALILLAVEEIAYRFQNPEVHSSADNAIWLRHQWMSEKHTDAQYRRLVNRLHHMRIRDVYFHAGPLGGNGSIPQKNLDGSAAFISRMKRIDPAIRLQPWLGQVAEFGGGGPLDLRSPKVRAEIVRTASRFLDVGADGFHIDLEPIYSGDRDYIDLLHGLHNLTRSRGALLSVAAYTPEPVAGMGWVAGLVAKCPGYWKPAYFLAVAREVDQVAVMCYDSGIPLPGLYGRSIAWVTRWSIRNGVDRLYVGIPTYEAGSYAHFTWSENLANSLHGLRLGVAGLSKADRAKVGAAIFAEWTTSPAEERAFCTDWIGPR